MCAWLMPQGKKVTTPQAARARSGLQNACCTLSAVWTPWCTSAPHSGLLAVRGRQTPAYLLLATACSQEYVLQLQVPVDDLSE
jgi:hypothetical protein